MRILIFSDIHLHNWLQFGGSRDREMSKRLQQQEDVLNQITDICQKEKVGLMLFGGDWFHLVGAHPTEVLHVTNRFFEKNTIPFIPVIGNHDLIATKNPEWFHIATTLLEGRDPAEIPFKLRLVHYHDDVRADEIEGYDIVLLHKQPKVTNEFGYQFDGVEWDVLAKRNRLVFFGHYHSRIELTPNCIVVGSPMHLTFGDKGDRGVYIVDTETWKPEFRKLRYPAFLTVDTPDQVKDDGNYYRVLHGGGMKPRENVVVVKEPPVFQERIKSDNFSEILQEWLRINNKDSSFLEVISDIVSDKNQLAKDIFKGRIVEVSIKDFMSVKDVQFKVENGFNFVAGTGGAGENAGSNGAGKTTIFGESIFWCLFGETTKGLSGNDVVRRGCKDCEVTVTLVSDGAERYEVSRSRKEGLIVCKVSAQGRVQELTEGLRQQDRQAFLENNILGFGKNVYRAACYFSQEDLLMLTGLTDSERTDMITNLLGFEVYDDLYERAQTKQKNLGTARKEIEDQMQKIQGNLNVINARMEENTRHRQDFERMITSGRIKVKEYEAEIERLNTEKGRILAEKPLVKDISEQIKHEETVLEHVDAEINNLDKVLSNGKYDTEIQRLQKDIGRLGGERDAALLQIQKLEQQIRNLRALVPNERCDKCGSLITKENIDLFIAEKTAEIRQLDDTVNRTEVTIRELSDNIAEIQKVVNNLREESRQFALKKQKVSQRLKELHQQQLLQEQERSAFERRLQSIDSVIESTKNRIQIHLEQVRDYGIKIKELDASDRKLLQEKEVIEAQLQEGTWRLEKIDRDVEILEFWKVAFSAKGIRSVLLDRFCNNFNQIVGSYLATASAGRMSLIVSPIAMTKGGEERNKIGMLVQLDGEAVRYESLSGGEKRRVDVSLCLAMNKWVSDRYGIPHGILGYMCLDEMFSFIDRVGEESIATLLFDEGTNKCIMVISHTPELASYASKVFTVRKSDGISELVDEKG